MIRIYQADCLDKMSRMEDCSVNAIVGDPPYRVTALTFDRERFNWELFWYHAHRICVPTANIILFSQQPFTTDLINSNRKGFRYEIIWHKTSATNFLNANRQPLKAHENILVFSRVKSKGIYNPQYAKGKAYVSNSSGSLKHWGEGDVPRLVTVNSGTRYPKSVITYQNGSSRKETNHPSEKPVELLEFLVKTYTNEGDLILDPFAGSGTTGVACLLHNRDCLMIEKDEEFVDECRKRIRKYKNLIAVG